MLELSDEFYYFCIMIFALLSVNARFARRIVAN